MEQNPHFLPEIWGLYIFGCIIFILRFFVRLRTVGIRGFSGDDYFAFAALILYTVDAVVVDRAYTYGTNVDFTEAEYAAMAPAALHRVQTGSKFQTVAWISYSALIWALKATMLFFYYRLTTGLRHRRLVHYLALATALTYLGVVLTLLLGCRPFAANWRVRPAPGPACSVRVQNLAVISAFNIATNLALLSVPVPLLWRLQLPRRQKLVVAAFLLTGVFVVVAAVIRVVVSLGPRGGEPPGTTRVNAWGVRETIVALVCVNAPMLRPLFLRRFWVRGGWEGGSQQGVMAEVWGRGGGEEEAGRGYGEGRRRPKGGEEDGVNDAGSEEYIMKNVGRGDVAERTVVVEVEVEVRSERRREDERTDEEMGNSAGAVGFGGGRW